MFERKDFTALTRLMDEYRAVSETDVRREYSLDTALWTVSQSAMEGEKALLDEWVRSTPGHWAPLLARARYYSEKAYEARGTKWAKDTSEQQFEGMKKYFTVALDDLKLVQAMVPGLLEKNILLIEIYQSVGDRVACERFVREGIKHVPWSYRIRKTYMHTLTPRWGGSYEAMEAFAREAEPYYDNNPTLKFLKGNVAWEKGQMAERGSKDDVTPANYDDAISYYRQALVFGDASGVVTSLVKALLKAGRVDEAIEAADKVIADHPKGDGYFLRSRCRVAQGRYDAALEDLETAERARKWLKPLAHPETAPKRLVPTRSDESDILMWEGHRLFENDKPGAIEKYTLALRFYKLNAKALTWRGIAYDRMLRGDEAYADLKAAIDADPRMFQAYKGLDDLLIKQGRKDEIIDAWTRYLLLEPADDNAYLERGGTFANKQDFGSAYRDFRRSCRLGNPQGCRNAEKAGARLAKGASSEIDAEVESERLADSSSADLPPSRVKTPEGKWTYRDSGGRQVVKTEFDDAWDFKGGLARVKKDGKWGYIDPRGEIAIPLRFDYCWDFEGDRAKVRWHDGTTGYIDRSGKKIPDI